MYILALQYAIEIIEICQVGGIDPLPILKDRLKQEEKEFENE